VSTDNLEPIRRVFRIAGLYNLAADDLLCEQLAAAAVQPQPYHWDGVNPPAPIAPQPQAPVGTFVRSGDHVP
jgi:hypothetical protein